MSTPLQVYYCNNSIKLSIVVMGLPSFVSTPLFLSVALTSVLTLTGSILYQDEFTTMSLIALFYLVVLTLFLISKLYIAVAKARVAGAKQPKPISSNISEKQVKCP